MSAHIASQGSNGAASAATAQVIDLAQVLVTRNIRRRRAAQYARRRGRTEAGMPAGPPRQGAAATPLRLAYSRS
jgi:hypothetical protein